MVSILENALKAGLEPGGAIFYVYIRFFSCTWLYQLKKIVFYVSGPGYVRN